MGKIDLGDLQLQVTQAIKVALTQGNDMLTLLGYAKQVKVTNPVAVIAQLARDEKMTIEQGKLWHKGYLDSLHERHGDVHEKSAFGIINGLTRSAQDYNASTREEMETLASKILAPAIDSSLQEISKRWGLIDARANQLEEKTSRQYQFVGV
jgi:polyhydroxyalkanoate synthesis regulator phasin